MRRSKYRHLNTGETRFPRGPHYMPVMPDPITACRRVITYSTITTKDRGLVTCPACARIAGINLAT
jgi:hypothetical protein